MICYFTLWFRSFLSWYRQIIDISSPKLFCVSHVSLNFNAYIIVMLAIMINIVLTQSNFLMTTRSFSSHAQMFSQLRYLIESLFYTSAIYKHDAAT